MTARSYLSDLRECLRTPMADGGLDSAMRECVELIRTANRVHLVGNGGSAAVVAHAQNDLVKAGGIRAHVYQDVPLLTALANDNGYGRNYSDPLAIMLDEGDALIAVSSSGKSPNMHAAALTAKAEGATVITFTGFEPKNPLRQVGHLNFYVPSNDYGFVELTHAALLHCLTDQVAHAR